MSKDKMTQAEQEAETRWPLVGENNPQKWLTFERYHEIFNDGAEWQRQQYGAGINPEAVRDLYDALVGMFEPFSYIGGVGRDAKFKAMEAAKAAIEKAKL